MGKIDFNSGGDPEDNKALGWPVPLAVLRDETDEEFGFNPANIQTTILFSRVGADVAALLEDIRSDDETRAIDFERIVEPPETISGRDARDWGMKHWGVDHNAGGAERVSHLNYPGVTFFTGEFPEAVLKALAAKHPQVSWQAYACSWHNSWGAIGEAKDGAFTFSQRRPKRRGEADDEFEQLKQMTFGIREDADGNAA